MPTLRRLLLAIFLFMLLPLALLAFVGRLVRR